jgi:hypothetical protein
VQCRKQSACSRVMACRLERIERQAQPQRIQRQIRACIPAGTETQAK